MSTAAWIGWHIPSSKAEGRQEALLDGRVGDRVHQISQCDARLHLPTEADKDLPKQRRQVIKVKGFQDEWKGT